MDVHAIILVASVALMFTIIFKIAKYGWGNLAPLPLLYAEFIMASILWGCSYIVGNTSMIIIWTLFLCLTLIQVAAGAYTKGD